MDLARNTSVLGEEPVDMLNLTSGDFLLDSEPLSASFADTGAEVVKCVAVLGASATGKSSLLNELFGCKFPVARRLATSSGAAPADMVRFALPLEDKCPHNQAMVVLDAPGRDATDVRVASYFAGLCDVILFNLWSTDLGRRDAGRLELLKSVFCESSQMNSPSEAQRTCIVFVVRDNDDNVAESTIKDKLVAEAKRVWASANVSDEFSTLDMSSLFDIEVVALPHAKFRKEEFVGAVAGLRARLCDPQAPKGFICRAQYSKQVPIDSFANFAGTLWSTVESIELPGALPEQGELLASFYCNQAYSKHMKRVSKQIMQWITQVDRGMTIANFGAAASSLMSSSLEAFDAETIAYAESACRAQKHAEMSQFMQQNIRSLFNKQIALLQSAAMNDFKKRLIDSTSDSGEVPATDEQQALNQADAYFTKRAQELMVSAMRLNFNAARLELGNAMNDYATRYAESPGVQLLAMERMEQAQAGALPPKQRGWGWGLSLTGAMRPRGYGNFQLLCGASKGPHVVNFSLCNDADAAEQEGQGKVPLFRMQPTLNIDVDL
ncbi:Protein SEY1-like [Porphyridium purpureum]|uniref:Protein SEY1-like n=1 Tax=Porphyridium purpureum TaxID=35688 RepID=A0A5J4YZC2_PORPP|nr:Protein SEY1-like [Porphyridium purpureum]|eukprot:POR5868..scf208_2